MVSAVRDESGKGRLGCLVWLLLFAAACYYGEGVGKNYIAYYRLSDEMQTQASLAPAGLDDAAIKRRLVAKAETLDLPDEAKHFTIRRSSREIVISTSWQTILELPFYSHAVGFHPIVRAPL